MKDQELKDIHFKTLVDKGVPHELAIKCAEILINDSYRSRTQEEQQLINQSWKILAAS